MEFIKLLIYFRCYTIVLNCARPGGKLEHFQRESLAIWGKLLNIFLVDDDMNIETAFAREDSVVCDMAVEAVSRKPDFMYVLFEEVDKAGHAGEYGSESYLETISREDEYTGRIYEAYEKAGIIDDTLFLVITDHGGIRNGHGGYTDEEKYIFLAAAGKNVPKGNIGHAYTRDLSAIILYGLGIDFPAYEDGSFTSQVPDGIFPEVNGTYYKVEPKRFDIESRPTPAIDGDKFSITDLIESTSERSMLLGERTLIMLSFASNKKL